MPPISVLIKPASGNCNMRCDYCFYCDEAKNRTRESYGYMSEATLKNLVRKFVGVAEGSCTFAFQGGEPTLWGLPNFRKFVEYVKKYNRKNIRIYYAIQTNGYYITPEWCEFFYEHHFLVGVSIDGFQDIHDSFRHGRDGNGSYKRVLETTRLFDKYHVEYNILTVVHCQTARSIEKVYQEYKKRGWHYLQFIPCLDPLGEERGKQKYSLLPEDYGFFLNKLFELWYKDIIKGEQPYIRQFENYIGILMGYLPESCEQRGICGIQNVVEADGSVYPCDFYVLDDFCLGNINEVNYAQIQEKRKEIDFIGRSLKQSSECKGCRWYSICKGGCYRNRDEKDRSYFCTAYRAFFESHYNHMAEIAAKFTLSIF